MPPWIYRTARAAGIWPWVRAARIAWLDWLTSEINLTDPRVNELVLERAHLERLP